MSPLFHPAILIFLVSSYTTFVVWIVRLERRNAVCENEIERLKKDRDTDNAENEKYFAEIKTKLDVHQLNGDIHFNQKVTEQVDKRNELRFQTIENHIGEMKQMLTKIAEKH
ncbi:MAG TPA: hypothetical protein PKY59_12395 [Pyrinomonadaceae bacterium]|nr:hypothetical protein [Pyrinomonadaceae bacterium]